MVTCRVALLYQSRSAFTTEPLPTDAFTIVHTRTVLNHLAAREIALAKLAAAVRPGGWLLVEEGDWVTWLPDPAADAAAQAIFHKHWQAHDQFARTKGVDHAYGRRLYGDLRALGLMEIGAEGRVAMIQGGSAHAEMWRMSFSQVREPLAAAGSITSEEMDALLTLLADPSFAWMGMTVVAAWGRRPAA
jgi:SAM-dependent methyltransferase